MAMLLKDIFKYVYIHMLFSLFNLLSPTTSQDCHTDIALDFKS